MRILMVVAALALAGPAVGQERSKVVERLYETMFELKVAALTCNDFVRGEPIRYSHQIDRYWASIGGAKQSDPAVAVEKLKSEIRGIPRANAREFCIDTLNKSLENYASASKGAREVTGRLGTIPPVFVAPIW